MSTIQLFPGDNRASLRSLIAKGVRVHSVVCDPPYSLTSIVKRFGKDGAAPAKFGKDGAFARASAGFMGLAWDASGIEYDPEFWALVYEILLPGGFVFAFSSPRTGHRQACAMEMVGFIMHPFHGWIYGSGMPKYHAADKAIDRHLGQKGEIIAQGAPVKRMIPGADQNLTGSWIKDSGREYQPGAYMAATEEAEQWSGYAYGTQTQKPAMEPIYLAQKPFSEKTGAANLLKHSVGAFNIDACRVPIDPTSDTSQIRTITRGQRIAADSGHNWGLNGKGAATGTVVKPDGRWPANILHDGSPEVVDLFPREAGASAPVRGTEPTKNGFSGTVKYGGMLNRQNGEHTFYGDGGSAARFFNSFSLTDDDYQLAVDVGLISDMRGFGLPIALYHGKASKADRAGGNHPTVKPIGLLRHLVRHITPPGGICLDPFAGSGTTGEAARLEGFDCLLMEAEPTYVRFLEQRFGLDDDLADLLAGPPLSDRVAGLQ
ncbi:hypothetical protein AEAC466_04335 [Asticcacaulis sp. AC466]|uniref:site-specific DNA-methyltransferase n=1 Tax=Asticcacaulis sp. AC466 TaxID=1282362 RepID=UPI0003C3C7D9|nr:site-specific DNA-methyltransferase [Asticcacaulis sp. AC466]ESQ85399.1 hypothetical protein AEAC466_04335 [Asticcacaulis sp. AC466]